MNKKIVTVLVILMMNMVALPAISSPTKQGMQYLKTPEKQQIQILRICIFEVYGQGHVWPLPGFHLWKIDNGTIKITYLGGEYNATSGIGIFILHLGPKETNDPVTFTGVSPIGIILK